ncbi:hypothetical protein ThidrDRAFT_4385 [Thiorhodococcus drewsii AZ1]|uniref:HprK-related kinase A n=1 Tax=Thiorhodococcus drewsii AZ1 TaxID=765913 RepID=G2E7X1_9GAMM|nr:HprK-related kinase A [Thiorhodococcus drewsii]EGV27811.1 hypothetical protein ThidrDRAFT_4385 [Thiorhodococcus drewsii AZ1]
MKISEFTPAAWSRALRGGDGVVVRIGPFVVRMQTAVSDLARLLHEMWGHYPLCPEEPLRDCHLRVDWNGWYRPWFRPSSIFRVDGRAPFGPFPARHHLPMLEWGLNFCIAQRSHHLLLLHSAVLERNGNALLLPAWPGHGKSTLCAALAHSGWRLFSDEFGLVDAERGQLLPFPRLIPLKNTSIEVIRDFAPKAHLGPTFLGTRKGNVAHVRPPEESVTRMSEPARARWLVFPRWVADAPLQLEPMVKPEAFLMVATNAFNYEVVGQQAFELVGRMVNGSDCYRLVYSDLAEAIAALDALAGGARV